MEDTNSTKKSFIKHVFNFDDDSKSDMINIIQYALLAIIPIVILNKTMQKYVPEADEQKGTLEILAEILIQIVVMFIGLLFIHRMVTYLPTYSGMDYPEFNVILIVLAVLIIILSLQTKIGEKVSILVDRSLELWDGKQPRQYTNVSSNKNIRVTQPISGKNIQTIDPIMPQNDSYGSSTSINSLPTIHETSSQNKNTTSSQQLPNYDNMYRQDNTPLVDAATPGQENFSEPMAANSILGGGSFGNW